MGEGSAILFRERNGAGRATKYQFSAVQVCIAASACTAQRIWIMKIVSLICRSSILLFCQLNKLFIYLEAAAKREEVEARSEER